MSSLLKKLFSKAIYTISYNELLGNFAVFHKEQGIVYVGEREKCVEFAKNTYH